MQGVIVRAIGGFYDVLAADGGICRCRARGRFKKDGISILVGDEAEFSCLAAGEGVLEEILPRRTSLVRPPVANINQVVIVCAPLDPPLSLQLVDRLLVLAESRSLRAVICLNKVDLAKGGEEKYLRSVYKQAGYKIVATSALLGEGLGDIFDSLAGRISVMAGPSGVGKSSLLNGILQDRNLRTGELSGKLGRGRHTTRHVELLPLANGGLVADTPGFSQLSLEGLTADLLQGCFPEVRELSDQCRFTCCRHQNEPDCAVKAAVKQGQVAASRYNNYLIFLAEVMERERSY